MTCLTSSCARRRDSCTPIRLQNVMVRHNVLPISHAIALRNHDVNENMADSMEGLSLERVVVEAVEMGYEAIKQEQMEAILSFLNKKDVLVVLPTNYGKSLCFGALPKIFDKVLIKVALLL